MEEMYEVLKFIEHDAHCRQSMDCIRGTVLLSYLKEHTQIEKPVLFSWFRELAVSVDQYHRSRSRQNYRYLNPCSIIVSDEGRLFLLDMEAPDNEPAMKRMQNRAVRSHFVKPIYEIGICRNNDADLFAYGRTIQFILAYSDIYPPINRREEVCLSRIIDRCTGESRKKYDDMRGILRDLPAVPKQQKYSAECGKAEGGSPAGKRMPVILVGSAVCMGVIVLAGVGRKGLIESRDAYERERRAEQQAEQMAEQQREEKEEQQRKETAREKENKETQEYLLDQAIDAYGKIMELEQDQGRFKEAGMKKMELEMQKGDYEQALETAGIVAGKAGVSEELEMLIDDCEENIP